MNTFELISNIDDFFDYRQGYEPFLKGLKLLSDCADEGAKFLSNIGADQNINEAASKFELRFASLIEQWPQIGDRFFKSQKLFSSNILYVTERWPESKEWLGRIRRDTEKLVHDYNMYIKNNNFDFEQAYSIANDSKSLSIEVREMLKSFRAISKGFEIPLPPEGSSALTLYFPGYVGILDTSNKLRAINSIYNEACDLFGVSAVEYPLVIAKLETGSFWVNLVGSAIVMTAVTSWIAEGAIWIYKNYTEQGQIVAISEKSENIEKLLGLRKKLKEANIDTKKMDRHISEAAIKISADLETLVTQSGIKVNGVWITPNKQDAKVQLDYSKSKELKKVETSINKLPPPKPK